AFLKPGGILAITTPDFNSMTRKIFKEKWMGFKEPEHLFYFTRENLISLLKSRGFKILKVGHEGKYVSLEFFALRLRQYSDFLGKMMGNLCKAKAENSN